MFMLFLDKDFDVIDSECLNGFIAPDYAEWTDSRSTVTHQIVRSHSYLSGVFDRIESPDFVQLGP